MRTLNKGYIPIELDRHNCIVKWPRIMRKITKTTLVRGWRTGATRFVWLECGHSYNNPASRPVGKNYQCIFCEAIWRYKMGRKELTNIEFALKGITSEMLNEMSIEAQLIKKKGAGENA